MELTNRAFGFVGSRNQASWVRAQAGRRLPNVEWVANDLDPAASAEFVDRWGGTSAPSLGALAERTGCVMIATPPGVRRAVLEEYLQLRAGRATVVLLQKPVATSLAEVAAMEQILVRHPRARVGVCLDRRPSAWWAAEQIADGKIGVPFEVELGFTCVGASDGLPPWFLNRRMSGGGAGMDLLPHPWDLVDTILGRPRILSVTAAALHRMIGPDASVEDSLIGTLRWNIDGGEPGVGSFRASWEDRRAELAVVIGGTEAYLEISRAVHRDLRAGEEEVDYVADETLQSRIITRDRRPRKPLKPEGTELSLGDCRANQVAEALTLLAALERGEDPQTTLPTLGEATRGLRLTLAAYDSAARGETVHDVL
jgi:predicted dehydrogenase